MNPRLIAVSGPLKGSIFPISESELCIGRQATNTICIEDELVSRRHCSLHLEAGRTRLRDFGSMNGTFVNNVAVNEADLKHGDILRVASAQFVYMEYEHASDSPPVFAESDDEHFTTKVTLRLNDDEHVYLSPDKIAEKLPSSERVARNLSALLRMSAAINAIRRSDELQARLLSLMLEIIPAERAAILLVGQQDDKFVSAIYRHRESGMDIPFRVSRTLTHQVLTQGVALMSNDVLADHIIRPTESLVAGSVRSVLCVPLTVFESKLGIIYADQVDVTAGFDRDHLELLTAIASVAAVAFEHCRYVEWLEGENQRLQEEISIEHDMIGDSPAMRDIYQFITRVSTVDSTVLIRGESGTGKELVARAIHKNSRRSARPFIAINCAALTETLLESELFGHERGAFTGAVTQKKGRFEVADGGTIFLDEIGELALTMQAKLLRALQEREFERVGGTRSIRVDVRVIAATNRDLEAALKGGEFRRDLFYRLNVVSILMPNLRDRREDIPLLAGHFVKKYSDNANRGPKAMSPDAYRLMMKYDWPGNVRELENAIERAVVLGAGDHILPEDLPEALSEKKVKESTSPFDYHDVLNQTKRELILKAVHQTRGNITEAAKLLKLHPNYLQRLITNLDVRSDLRSNYTD